jgi:ABC-2 type transport system permease protein
MTTRNVWTIARRDFRSYFTSPIAYIIIAGFLFIMGYMFFSTLSYYNLNALRYQQYNMGKGVSITDGIIRPLFGNMNVVFLFMVPFITMRLIAEEKKLHTIELLLTSPITLVDLVFGKFLSSLLLVGIMLLLTVVYPVILMATGTPELGPIVASYAGTLLLVGCYLAIGILFSSMTENQIVAGALTFAGGLFFWLVSWAQQTAGPVWGEILNYLSLISHYNNFGKGLVDTSDVLYYFSFIGLGLFLTHRVLDSYRWR